MAPAAEAMPTNQCLERPDVQGRGNDEHISTSNRPPHCPHGHGTPGINAARDQREFDLMSRKKIKTATESVHVMAIHMPGLHQEFVQARHAICQLRKADQVVKEFETEKPCFRNHHHIWIF